MDGNSVDLLQLAGWIIVGLLSLLASILSYIAHDTMRRFDHRVDALDERLNEADKQLGEWQRKCSDMMNQNENAITRLNERMSEKNRQLQDLVEAMRDLRNSAVSKEDFWRAINQLKELVKNGHESPR